MNTPAGRGLKLASNSDLHHVASLHSASLSQLAEERYQWCISLKLGSGAQRGAAQWSLVLAYCAKEDAGKAIEICEKCVYELPLALPLKGACVCT